MSASPDSASHTFDASARSAHLSPWPIDLTSTLGRAMPPVWKRFGAAHKSLYLASGGRIGDRLLGIPMLLLSTRGRKTGLVRTMPLAYLPDPETPDTCVIVASNGGSPRPPAWWLNLQATDRSTVQVGTQSYWARASVAPAERRSSLWQQLRSEIPPYRVYEQIEREIPIVLLERLGPDEQ